LPCPVPLPRFATHQYWRADVHKEKPHQWLRKAIREFCVGLCHHAGTTVGDGTQVVPTYLLRLGSPIACSRRGHQSLLAAAPLAVPVARHQAPVLSMPCGAGLLPACSVQSWPAASALARLGVGSRWPGSKVLWNSHETPTPLYRSGCTTAPLTSSCWARLRTRRRCRRPCRCRREGVSQVLSTYEIARS
jgi:hypothetical protein